MEDLNKYTDTPDDFTRAIRERLKDHRLSIEDAGWEDLEKKLAGQSSPRWRRQMLWIAAALIPLFLLLPLWWVSKEREEIAVQTEITPVFSEENSFSTIERKKADPEPEDKLYPESLPLPGGMTPIQNKSGKKVEKKSEVTDPYELEPEELTDKQEANEVDPEPVYPTFQDPVEMPSRRPDNRMIAYQPVKNRSSSWQIGAGFGTGGGVSLSFGDQNGPYYDMNNGNEIWNPSNPTPPPTIRPDKDDELIPTYYNDYSYSVPFSVSLLVRKHFHERIAVETGLQYSYLSTRFYSSSNHLREARSDLHYLGVPVNLVVTAWRQDNWSIYFSAGVTLEKGLRHKIHKYGRPGYFPDDSSVGKSIPGIQWSLNIAPGISFRIFREWDLYIEPRFSYFFDNDQPYSLRTDKPAVIGVAGGLRYSF